MDQSLLDALSMLSPEELEQAFTPFDQQMAMAQQLRKPSGQPHSTGWGAALGGLGDALGNTVGAYRQNQTMHGEQADALARAMALRQGRGNPQAAAGAMGNTSADLESVLRLLGQPKAAPQQAPEQPWAGVPYPY